jgi:hypothetical protein
MTNSKKNFPYLCAHLWYYLQVEKLNGKQIMAKVIEINAWLNETCIITCVDWFSPTADGQYPVLKEEQWMWDTWTTRVPMYHNLYGTTIPAAPPMSTRMDWDAAISLSNSISFMHQDDLLAFKLKFGISDGIKNTHPE